MNSEVDGPNEARGNPVSSYHLDVRLSEALSFVPPTTRKLLDIGCGEGYFIERVLRKHAEIEATGADPAQSNLDKAQRIAPAASFVKGTAERIRFPSGTFDCVSCLEVLDHLPDVDRAISEMGRVLKAGGTLIVSVPSYDNLLWRPIWALWTRTLGRKWKHAHDHEFSIQKLHQVLKRRGFTDIQRTRTFFGLISVITCRRER